MYYILVITSVFIASLAQMLLKKGASLSHPSTIREYINIWVICGYTLMGASLLINIYALSNGIKVKELSIIESLSYLFVPLLSFLIFKESITLKKAFSIMIIIVGVFVFFY